MNDIITFVLAIATFAYVAYPLLLSKPVKATDAGDSRLEELYSKRNTTYSMIKELEFDYNSGILTDEDYRDLQARYKDRAVNILKNIDEESGAASDIEADLEREVQKSRRGKGTAPSLDDELENLVRQSRKKKPAAAVETARHEEPRERVPSRGPYCPQCGEKSESGDRFCTYCGTKLVREEQ